MTHKQKRQKRSFMYWIANSWIVKMWSQLFCAPKLTHIKKEVLSLRSKKFKEERKAKIYQYAELLYLDKFAEATSVAQLNWGEFLLVNELDVFVETFFTIFTDVFKKRDVDALFIKKICRTASITQKEMFFFLFEAIKERMIFDILKVKVHFLRFSHTPFSTTARIGASGPYRQAIQHVNALERIFQALLEGKKINIIVAEFGKKHLAMKTLEESKKQLRSVGLAV